MEFDTEDQVLFSLCLSKSKVKTVITMIPQTHCMFDCGVILSTYSIKYNMSIVMFFWTSNFCSKMDQADLADFTSIADENGEISKTDLIIHTKASSFWRSYMESKSRPGAVTSKVVQTASSYFIQCCNILILRLR